MRFTKDEQGDPAVVVTYAEARKLVALYLKSIGRNPPEGWSLHLALKEENDDVVYTTRIFDGQPRQRIERPTEASEPVEEDMAEATKQTTLL